MTIKEFEKKHKVRFTYSEFMNGDGCGYMVCDKRDAYFLHTEKINDGRIFEVNIVDNNEPLKSDFLKVVENLERIRKYKGKTIAGVIEEFNKKYWNKYECGVTDDEGYDYPLYVVTDMKGNRLTDMQCGMISILRYKQFTPEFGLMVSNLFNDIFNIEELEENEI